MDYNTNPINKEVYCRTHSDTFGSHSKRTSVGQDNAKALFQIETLQNASRII